MRTPHSHPPAALSFFSIASILFHSLLRCPQMFSSHSHFVVQHCIIYHIYLIVFKIIMSKILSKMHLISKNPLKPMKNTTKISPGVLSMPGDIVTHASFNFSTVCQISPLTGTDPAPPPRSSGASPAAHWCSCPWDMTSSTWRSARRSASGSAAVTMRSAAFPGSSVPVS